MAPSTVPSTIVPMTTGSVVTSWLPLTTTFTAPDRCSTKFLMEYYAPDSSIVAYDPNWGISVQGYDICQPEQITDWYVQPTDAATVTSVGPFICPQSWGLGATSVISQSVQDELDRVTMSLCCPPGYSRDGSDQFYITWCSSSVASGGVLTYQASSKVDSSSVEFVPYTTSFSSQYEVYAVAAVGGNYGSTTASTTTTSIPTTITAGGTATNTGGTTVVVHKGLSSGAVAGIGIGAAAAALGVAALVAFWFFRRRKRMPANANGDFPPAEQVGFPAEDKSAFSGAGGTATGAAAVGATVGSGVAATEPGVISPMSPEMQHELPELPPAAASPPLVELYGGPGQPAELS